MTGCKTTEDSVVSVPSIVADLPKDFYKCKPWPKTLHGGATQKNVAQYIVIGHDAHKDCKNKLSIAGAINTNVVNEIKNLPTSSELDVK